MDDNLATKDSMDGRNCSLPASVLESPHLPGALVETDNWVVASNQAKLVPRSSKRPVDVYRDTKQHAQDSERHVKSRLHIRCDSRIDTSPAKAIYPHVNIAGRGRRSVYRASRGPCFAGKRPK